MVAVVGKKLCPLICLDKRAHLLFLALAALSGPRHRVRDANLANEGGEEHANHARPQDVALVASVGSEVLDDGMGGPKDNLAERLVGKRSRRSLNPKLVDHVDDGFTDA